MAKIVDLVAVQAHPHLQGMPFQGFADEARRHVAQNPGIDLLVFPELHLFHCDLLSREAAVTAINAVAEPLGGPLDTALAALAAELRVTLVPGTLWERGASGELFNTAQVYGPDGTVLATYRKVFPWRPGEPSDPGDRFVVFDLPAREDRGRRRIGLTICYDAWFPEVTRQVAWLGAELVLNLVKTVTADRPQEVILAQANAITNQLYMLSLNCAGPVGRGDSLLVGPEGEVVVACTGEAAGVIRQKIDLDRVSTVRRDGTCGENRLWLHFRPGEPRIALPAYNGYIDPATWAPAGLD